MKAQLKAALVLLSAVFVLIQLVPAGRPRESPDSPEHPAAHAAGV